MWHFSVGLSLRAVTLLITVILTPVVTKLVTSVALSCVHYYHVESGTVITYTKVLAHQWSLKQSTSMEMTVSGKGNTEMTVRLFECWEYFWPYTLSSPCQWSVDKERIKKRPYGRAHQRIMICCYSQKKKREGGKVTSALLGPARRKQLGKMAQISVLRGGAPSYQL